MTSKQSGSTDATTGNVAVPGWRTPDGRDGADNVPVERLTRELTTLQGDQADEESGQQLEQLVSSVRSTLFPETSFRFDKGMITQNIDEVLLLLIALRESETNGKQLMDDLSTLFDADVSPGTAYPRLHELEEEDVLMVQELVRTKEYKVDDSERARARLEEAMRQHLALGYVFAGALDQL